MASTYEIWRKNVLSDNRFDFSTYTKILDVEVDNEIVFIRTLQENEMFYREQMSQDITFSNQSYKNLLELKEGASAGKTHLFIVKNSGVIRWKGFFSFSQGFWDESGCTASLKTNVFDDYSCLLDSYKTKRNILDIEGAVVFRTNVYSFYEFRTILVNPCNPVAETDGEWTNIHEVTQTTDCGGTPVDITYTIAFVQARKRSQIDPGGWTEITDEDDTYYVNSIGVEIVAGDISTSFTCANGSAEPIPGKVNIYDGCDMDNVFKNGSTFDHGNSEVPCISTIVIRVGCDVQTQNVYIDEEVYSTREFVGTINYTNGRFLKNVLQTFISKQASGIAFVCDFELKSDFLYKLQNPVTGEIPNPLQYLTFAQKTDIKLPNATEKASILEYSLEEIMQLLKHMIDGWWIIDENGFFRFEHRSFFEKGLSYTVDKVVGIDARTKVDPETNIGYIDGTNKYTYDDTEPISEIQYLFAESKDKNFVGTPLLYKDDSLSSNRIVAIEQVIADITTDFNYVTGNPSEVANKGGMLLSLFKEDSSEIVVNGGFDADEAWEKTGASAIVGGVGRFTGVGSLRQQSQLVVFNNEYDYSITITNYVGDGVVNIGGTVAQLINGNGTFTGTVTVLGEGNTQIVVASEGGGFDVDNFSLTLVTSTIAFVLIEEIGLLDPEVLPNNHLSWGNLVPRYLTFGRLFEKGFVNNVEVDFDSVKKKKVQIPITVPLCGEDYDPGELIATYLGNGEVVESEENNNTTILTVTLKYE